MSNQPKGLAALGLAELIGGFIYFAIVSTLVTYLTSQYHFTNAQAYMVYGIFLSLAYAMPVVGGAIADHWLSERVVITYGILLIIVGDVLLALNEQVTFSYGLSIFVIGISLIKPSTLSLLGKLYDNRNKHIKERGFTIIYALMNTGAIAGPLVFGYLHHWFNWRVSYGAGALFTLASLGIIFLKWKELGPTKRRNLSLPTTFVRHSIFWLGLVATTVIIHLLFNSHRAYDIVVMTFMALLSIYIAAILYKQHQADRMHLVALLILIIFSLLFFTAELQIGSSIIIFAQQNLGNIGLPPAAYASMLALAVVAGAIVMRPVYTKLEALSPAARFQARCIIGLTLSCISFAIFSLAASSMIVHVTTAAFVLVIIGNLLLGFGEVSIAPLVNAAVSILAPTRLQGTFMGVNYLATATSGFLAGYVAQIFTSSHIKHQTNEQLYHTFLLVSGYCLISTIIAILLTPLIKKLVNAKAI